MWPIAENLAEGLIRKRMVYKTVNRIKGDLICNLSTTLAWLRIADMKGKYCMTLAVYKGEWINLKIKWSNSIYLMK